MASASVLNDFEWSRSNSEQILRKASKMDELCCRACNSTALRTDFAQGDRVCTDCGVVDEERILDDRPEWREFNDDNDLAKGGPSLARSGLVLVDETQYLGGLQPTTLSKTCFGNRTDRSLALRKRLLATNRKLDKAMEKTHQRTLESARLDQRLRKRKMEDFESDVPPEYWEFVLQEEEDSRRVQTALRANKWSLARAKRLFGSSSPDMEEASSTEEDIDDERIKNDKVSFDAAKDLYHTYVLLLDTAQKLHLPDLVTNEATHLLCQYAALKDGIIVRGVSSTLKRKDRTSRIHEQEARKMLREYNKQKQAASLVSALLFYTSRHMGYPRALTETCESVQPFQSSKPSLFQVEAGQFIKKKHCSKAMNEIKVVFPHLAQHDLATASRVANNNNNVASFVEHTIRSLSLPPLAEACVRVLSIHCQKESSTLAKPAVVCAAVAHFICNVGDVMQKLALQATKKPRLGSNDQKRIKTDKEFDMFDEELSSELSAEHRAYEMAKVYDAWAEQTPWARAVADIEHSCGVARSSFLEFYRKEVYPQRRHLLTILRDAVESDKEESGTTDAFALQDTPLASVLLPNIVVVSSLLKES